MRCYPELPRATRRQGKTGMYFLHYNNVRNGRSVQASKMHVGRYGALSNEVPLPRTN